MSSRLYAQAKKLLATERNVGTSWKAAQFPSSREVLSIALAYPNLYYTGMSNLGFQTVYRLFNEQSATECQRVFLPDPEDLEEYQRTNTPLFTLESQRPVRDFDLLAFSVPYENDYPHLLQIMELAKIPLLKKDRQNRDPLVMAGGATVFMNPEPLADFIDFFVIGEAEAIISPLAELLRQKKRGKSPRSEILRDLTNLAGVYVPQFYQVTYHQEGTISSFLPHEGAPPQVKRVWLKDLDLVPTLSAKLTPHTEFSEMLLAELTRGCSRRCRFCASCYIYYPFRRRGGRRLKEIILKEGEEASKIGLLGAAISDYPDLIPLGREMVKSQKSLSFSSLRVDSLTPELADLIKESGQKTVTLAPEAGSERMRRLINKGFTEEEILKAVDILGERGLSHLRLYFMVGLPWEEMADIREIIELSKKIQHRLIKKRGGQKGGGKIILSLNSFVPKPATPFQWHPFEDLGRLKEKIKIVKKSLAKEPQISVMTDVPNWAYLQALLARGDRRVGKLLLAAHKLKGNWSQAYRSVDINPDFYVFRERWRDEIFPWDFIDHGLSKDFLWAEYEKARQEAQKG